MVTSAEIADMLSTMLGQRLEASVLSPHLVEHTEQNYMFVNQAEYIMLTGVSKAVKENESISGDNYTIIESEKGKKTILLSDGMGSGERASESSEKVLDLMEKMMEAGYGMDTAINLVNNALVSQGEEQNLSTLDICDLDLYTGSCCFLKAGASASFLKRGNVVEEISSHNLPLGIFPSIDMDLIYRELMDGDYLILMTDGVLDALEKNNYEEAMCQMISGMQEQNPKEIADKLLQFVLHCSGGRIPDDMTIIVVGVWENSVGD
jgi:stage II sporulation protein E